MDDFLSYDVERLVGKLKENRNTNTAFKILAEIITDFSELVEKEDRGIVRGLIRKAFMLARSMSSHFPRLGDAFSSRYESKIDELRKRFKRAKQGLMDSIEFGIWERVMDEGESATFIINCRCSSSP